ncbi:MAG: glycerol kinase [Chitinophagaceae bacterium]|nr:glycerol kinase [Chitinophagaceae bacterium]
MATLLNATAIGKQFSVSSQRINLILSELGFQENDVAGWEVTKLGKSLGGRQFQHEQSGKFYVLWPETILTNKNLVQVFDASVPEKVNDKKSVKSETPNLQTTSDNFRHKYPAIYRTQDGHFVRSKSEVIIDNWLYISGLVHSYEKKLPIDEDLISDFYIPSGNGRPQAVYIEFWGLENDQNYQERMKKKIELYKKYDLPLIELKDKDIENTDDVLPRKLLLFKIKVSV